MKLTGKVTLLTAALFALSATCGCCRDDTSRNDRSTNDRNNNDCGRTLQKIQKKRRRYPCISQVKNQNTLVFTKQTVKRTTKWTVSQSRIHGNGTEAGYYFEQMERC